MCYNGFTTKINLFKYKRFKDGKCRYKSIVSSHLKSLLILWRSLQKQSLFFSYKSWNFEGYETVPTLIFINYVVLMCVNTDHDVREWDCAK